MFYGQNVFKLEAFTIDYGSWKKQKCYISDTYFADPYRTPEKVSTFKFLLFGVSMWGWSSSVSRWFIAAVTFVSFEFETYFRFRRETFHSTLCFNSLGRFMGNQTNPFWFLFVWISSFLSLTFPLIFATARLSKLSLNWFMFLISVRF